MCKRVHEYEWYAQRHNTHTQHTHVRKCATAPTLTIAEPSTPHYGMNAFILRSILLQVCVKSVTEGPLVKAMRCGRLAFTDVMDG